MWRVMLPAAHTNGRHGEPIPARWTALILGAVWLITAAWIARALVLLDGRAWWGIYVLLGAAFLVIFTLALLRPPAPDWPFHAALAIECLIVLALLAPVPQLDFLSSLFPALALLAGCRFSGRTVWVWVALVAVLTVGSLMAFVGPLPGLARALPSVAVAVVFAACILFLRELEAARHNSQTMLRELQTQHQRLQHYAAEAADLAAIEQRERVARDLNESMAQAVERILAAARAARDALGAPADDDRRSGLRVSAGPKTAAAILSAASPAPEERAAEQVAALADLTQDALTRMRSLVTELRPAGE